MAVTDEARIELDRLQRTDQGESVHDHRFGYAATAEERLGDFPSRKKERVNPEPAWTEVLDQIQTSCLGQIDGGEGCQDALGTAEVGTAEIGAAEVGKAEVCMDEAGTAEIGTA